MSSVPDTPTPPYPPPVVPRPEPPRPPVGSPTGAEGGDADDARVAGAADVWKRKLLDLTKRNRALNFRPAKVSTVAILDEHPAEVFRRLYVREQPMRFKAAPEPEGGEDGTERSAPPSAEGQMPTVEGGDATDAADEYEAPELDFAPYDPVALDERHTDEWLQ